MNRRQRARRIQRVSLALDGSQPHALGGFGGRVKGFFSSAGATVKKHAHKAVRAVKTGYNSTYPFSRIFLRVSDAIATRFRVRAGGLINSNL